MKILIIISTGIVGGPGKGLIQFLKYSSNYAYDYRLYNFKAVWLHEDRESSFNSAAKSAGLELKLLKQYIPFDPTIILRTLKIVKEYQPDVIQTHGAKPNVIGYVLKKLQQIPWIGFAHGYTLDNIKIKLYNRTDRYFLRAADAIVAVSQMMKTLLSKNGVDPKKITVIHNAIDKDEFLRTVHIKEMRKNLGLSGREPVIGVVGRLGPEKGQLYFLHALRSVLKIYPDVQALIIGSGKDAEMLRTYCLNNNIQRNVNFVGHVSNIADYYQVMNMLVIPSIAEGLPNVMLEAMAFGIPVIATEVGGIPEVINSRSGILVAPGQPESLAKAMLILIENESLSKTFIENASHIISTSFSPDIRTRKIIDVYNRILNPLI